MTKSLITMAYISIATDIVWIVIHSINPYIRKALNDINYGQAIIKSERENI